MPQRHKETLSRVYKLTKLVEMPGYYHKGTEDRKSRMQSA